MTEDGALDGSIGFVGSTDHFLARAEKSPAERESYFALAEQTLELSLDVPKLACHLVDENFEVAPFCVVSAGIGCVFPYLASDVEQLGERRPDDDEVELGPDPQDFLGAGPDGIAEDWAPDLHLGPFVFAIRVIPSPGDDGAAIEEIGVGGGRVNTPHRGGLVYNPSLGVFRL